MLKFVISDPSFISWLEKRQKKPIPGKPPSSTETSSATQASTTSAKTSTASKSQSVKSDVPIKPEKAWVNMDKIEYDKLAWMKDLPPPKTGDDKLTGKPVRFDFDGKIVTADADVPVHLGLHHHGDEPEVSFL